MSNPFKIGDKVIIRASKRQLNAIGIILHDLNGTIDEIVFIYPNRNRSAHDFLLKSGFTIYSKYCVHVSKLGKILYD